MPLPLVLVMRQHAGNFPASGLQSDRIWPQLPVSPPLRVLVPRPRERAADPSRESPLSVVVLVLVIVASTLSAAYVFDLRSLAAEVITAAVADLLLQLLKQAVRKRRASGRRPD